jgi:predicted acetyltransferase
MRVRTPMTADIRTPSEDDRAQVIDVLRTSLNFPRSWAEERGSTTQLADYRCAYEGGRLVATAAAYRFRQWFGGRDLAASGVYAVATLPEHRGMGLGSAVVLQVLRDAREEGASVSALYPAVLRPYRSLGFELGGSFSEHRLPLDAIPSDLGTDLPPVLEFDPDRDLVGLRACYRAWARHGNGPVEPTDDDWWMRRILRPFGDAISRAVVVRADDGSIEGFAAFRYADADGGHLEIDFGLECLAFSATTERATRAMLAYFRSFRGVGLWIQWCGPPEDPIAMLVPEQQITTPFRFRWMLRLLDVRNALAARGYPPVDADVVVAVDDPAFPENAGPWRLTVHGGEAAVEPAPDARVEPMPVGILSTLFSGFLTVPDAVRLGYLRSDDPAVAGLQQLLAGSDPWCPFFF